MRPERQVRQTLESHQPRMTPKTWMRFKSPGEKREGKGQSSETQLERAGVGVGELVTARLCKSGREQRSVEKL